MYMFWALYGLFLLVSLGSQLPVCGSVWEEVPDVDGEGCVRAGTTLQRNVQIRNVHAKRVDRKLLHGKREMCYGCEPFQDFICVLCVVRAGEPNRPPWTRAPPPRATRQELPPPTNCLRCWATTRAKTTSRSARQVFIFCIVCVCVCHLQSQSSSTAAGHAEVECGALLNVRVSQCDS